MSKVTGPIQLKRGSGNILSETQKTTILAEGEPFYHKGAEFVTIGNGESMLSDLPRLGVGTDISLISAGNASSIQVNNGAISVEGGGVSIGSSSNANGSNSVVIGENSSAGSNAITIGVDSVSTDGGVVTIGKKCASAGADAIAIGTNSGSSRDCGIAIGTNCSAEEKYEIAIGTNCSAKGTGAIAIGTNCAGNMLSKCILVGNDINSGSSSDSIMLGYSVFANSNGVAIGNGSNSSGEYGISIGTNSEATNSGGVSVGRVAKSSTNSISIGTGANSYGEDSVAIGHGAHSTHDCGISIGSASHSYNSHGISIGDGSVTFSQGSNGLAIGTMSSVTNPNGIAIGNESSVSGANGIAIGCISSVSGPYNIAIGSSSQSFGDSNIVIGKNCSTKNGGSNRSIVIGKDCIAYGENGVIAIGDYVNQGTVNGSNAIAIGTYITHFDGESVAIGHGAGSNIFGVALGFQANASGNFSVALGQNASVTEDKTIRLGSSDLSKLSCVVELTRDSDTRDKADISTIPSDKSLKFINSIDPIQYVSNDRSYYPVTESTKTKKKCSYFEYDVEEHKKATNKGKRGRVGVKAQQVYKNLRAIFGSDNYANLVDDDLYDLDEVPSDRESKLTVAYGNFVPLLIGSIKELSKLVSNLQKEVDSLKEELNSRDSDVGDTQTTE